MKSAWKIKARWYSACPTAGERRFFQNEIYLHPLTWDITIVPWTVPRDFHQFRTWPKSLDKMNQTKIVCPTYWRLEIPPGRVSFTGKVNSTYFQSSLKISLKKILQLQTKSSLKFHALFIHSIKENENTISRLTRETIWEKASCGSQSVEKLIPSNDNCIIINFACFFANVLFSRSFLTWMHPFLRINIHINLHSRYISYNWTVSIIKGWLK